MSKALAYLRDESGASAAEYAVMLAILGAGFTAPATFLNNNVGNAIYGAAICVKTLAGGGHC